MKTENMTSINGNKVANQFIITDNDNMGNKVNIFNLIVL
jgi:hypothetical protein